jgi:hypothetical protein
MKHTFSSALAALLVGAAGCGNITDINTSPNGPVDVPPPSILAAAVQNLGNTMFGMSFSSLDVRGAGLWVQYYSEIQYRDEEKFILRSGTSGGFDLYFGALEDFQRMTDKGVASSTPNWEAVGRIMKTYTFSVMTDAMGDLPYTEALKGDSGMFTPAYDTQQSIYDSLFANLALANSQIDPTGVGFSGTADILYGGNMALWRMFANSLRLRLAMHLTERDAAKAQSQAAAAIAGGVFGSNSDNARILYLASAPNQNPVFNDYKTRDDFGMSKTYVDSLTSWNDPRLPIFSDTNNYGAYRGLENGLLNGQGATLDSISRLGRYWAQTPGAPLTLLGYSEVLFLEAEAAERGWCGTCGVPADLYLAAITASLQQYGISASKIATYLADPRVAYDANGTSQTAHLRQIWYQKWVSMFMQGAEAWTEWRRTQWPVMVPGCNATTMRHMPERLPYDDQELVLNNANVTAAVSAQGLSSSRDLSKPLWFTGRTTSTDYPPPPCP